MDKEVFFTKLADVSKEATTSIIYSQFGDEIDCTTIPFFHDIYEEKIYVPKGKNTDPFFIARDLTNRLQNKKVCIFIPGKQFDIFGTRHGKGGGWYDRFLSCVPTEWVRIGVIDTSKLSFSHIERKPWDQLVDWVIVKGEVWQIYKTDSRAQA